MSLLDLHAEDFAKAATNTAYIPPPAAPPASKFNAWKTFTAAPRGARSGAQESVAFMADVLNAFGTAYATTEPAAPLGMLDPAPKDTEAARQQMLKGLDYNSEAGDLFREVARASAPDPQTAHVAENLLYEFPRFATKAVGYSLAGGPVVGAGLTAADEGMTASDALRRQGVDLATRTKVGAVQGVGAGLGVLLPVAGKTALQTAGLVAAGGPGTFIAQQAITREILKSADYSKLADQYDPLDPVGLAVSTLVPAGFGAFAMRGTRRAKAADVPPREVVDAAMVTHQQEVRDAAALAPKEDLAAQAKHTEALGRAEEQMARGEPVRVADGVLPDVERAANFRAWFGDSKVVDEQGAPRVMYHGTRSDIAQFDSARLGEATGADSSRLGFFFTDTVSGESAGWMARGAEVWAADREGSYSGGGNVVPVYLAVRNPYAARGFEMAEAHSSPGAADALRAKAIAAGHDGITYKDGEENWVIAFRPEQIKSSIGNSGRFDPNSGSLTDPLTSFAGRVQSATRAADKEAKAAGLVPEKPARADVTPPPEAGTQAAAEPPKPPAGKAAEPGRPAADAGPDTPATPGPEETAANTARLAEIEQQFPDLMVQMDGMDKPQRLSDFLAAVQREADEMRADAPDFEVAANCFLTMGA